MECEVPLGGLRCTSRSTACRWLYRLGAQRRLPSSTRLPCRKL